jgi:hypothetical protein
MTVPLWSKKLICGRKMRNFVPPLGRAFIAAVALLSVAAVINAFHLIAAGIHDWMFMSGCALALLGILLAQGLPDRLEEALERLGNRGALVIRPEQVAEFKSRLEAWIVRYWAPCAGAAVAAAIAVAFLVASNSMRLQFSLYFFAGAVIGGYVVGCYLGRMACYGFLGYFFGQSHIHVSIIPGHLDAVAGLKPIGDFYLRQAAIVGLPAVYVAAWLVLMRLQLFKNYHVWHDSYVGLLFLAILFEITSFIAPLWWFHREMARQKRVLLREVDKLWPKIVRLKSALADCDDPNEMKALKDRLDERTGRYSAIEQLPVWPFDLRTIRVFSLSNVALFIPLMAEWSGLAGPWAELVQKVFEKAGGGH